MMLLLFNHDVPKRSHGLIVEPGQRLDLRRHVPKHDPLDSHGRGGNGATARKPRQGAEHEAAKAAPGIASASALAAPRQLVPKARAMPPLMGKKMIELRHHLRRSPPGEPPLRQIDAHGAMLARVIDFHHAVAKGFTRVQTRYEGHGRQRAAPRQSPQWVASGHSLRSSPRAGRIGPLYVTLPRTAKRGSRQRPVSRMARRRSTAVHTSSKPR